MIIRSPEHHEAVGELLNVCAAKEIADIGDLYGGIVVLGDMLDSKF